MKTSLLIPSSVRSLQTLRSFTSNDISNLLIPKLSSSALRSFEGNLRALIKTSLLSKGFAALLVILILMLQTFLSEWGKSQFSLLRDHNPASLITFLQSISCTGLVMALRQSPGANSSRASTLKQWSADIPMKASITLGVASFVKNLSSIACMYLIPGREFLLLGSSRGIFIIIVSFFTRGKMPRSFVFSSIFAFLGLVVFFVGDFMAGSFFKGTPLGYMLVLVNLASDGFINRSQACFKESVKSDIDLKLLLAANAPMAPLALLWQMFVPNISPLLQQMTVGVAVYCIGMGFLNTISQYTISLFVAKFNGLLLSTIVTSRKFLSIVVSILVFSSLDNFRMNIFHFTGILVICNGLVYFIYQSKNEGKEKAGIKVKPNPAVEVKNSVI